MENSRLVTVRLVCKQQLQVFVRVIETLLTLMNRTSLRRTTTLFTLSVCVASCVRTLPAVPETVGGGESLAVGHVQTALIGSTTRWWPPELRFFEVTHAASGQRFRIEVDLADGWFLVPLPPGTYGLDRAIFDEGAFQEATQLGLTFEVMAQGVTYVGTWRFGLETPQVQRELLWSAIAEPDEVIRETLLPWTVLTGDLLSTHLPEPSVGATRLYEVPPYPRVWFFRRHQTT